MNIFNIYMCVWCIVINKGQIYPNGWQVLAPKGEQQNAPILSSSPFLAALIRPTRTEISRYFNTSVREEVQPMKTSGLDMDAPWSMKVANAHIHITLLLFHPLCSHQMDLYTIDKLLFNFIVGPHVFQYFLILFLYLLHYFQPMWIKFSFFIIFLLQCKKFIFSQCGLIFFYYLLLQEKTF